MAWDLIPGDYEVGNKKSSVAVVTLNTDIVLEKGLVAISGRAMTENQGVTRILANILSNPYIRHLIVCGKEVGGHFSGDALISFYNNGYDVNDLGSIRIKNTKAADPRLPIETAAIEEVHTRFREQITLVGMIGETDVTRITEKIKDCLSKNQGPMNSPYILALKKGGEAVSTNDDVAICSRVRIAYNQVVKR